RPGKNDENLALRRWRFACTSTTFVSLQPNIPMKLNFSFTGVLVLTLCAVARVQSQSVLDLPYASQAAQVKQQVGVTDITITYHRPLVNGRKIWDGLVPMGKVWRSGANENTTIEFSTPVSIE